VPLGRPLAEVPKVLVAGGISRVHAEPVVRAFLEARGLAVKLEDMAEFLYHFVVQVEVTRAAYHRGVVAPEEQFAWRRVVADVLRGGGRDARRSLRARVECAVIDALVRRWRDIVGRSGLLFDRARPLRELVRLEHQLVSHNTFTEATTTLGRFLVAARDGVYDGVVNVGSFCCAEVHQSEALIAPHVGEAGVAFSNLAVEGLTLSAEDVLKLETLAAQCWRRREGR